MFFYYVTAKCYWFAYKQCHLFPGVYSVFMHSKNASKTLGRSVFKSQSKGFLFFNLDSKMIYYKFLVQNTWSYSFHLAFGFLKDLNIFRQEAHTYYFCYKNHVFFLIKKRLLKKFQSFFHENFSLFLLVEKQKSFVESKTIKFRKKNCSNFHMF